MTISNFLSAFTGKNDRVPVWFMRQAGRYLPQYQRLKEKYSLAALFSTPELAAEVTCMQIPILNVDAAILFADILTLPSAMGAKISFDSPEGPKIEPLRNFKQLRDVDNFPKLTQTIKLVNQKLAAHIPLIGFAGGPFTVLTYLIEGGSSATFSKTFQFMYQNPAQFSRLMDKLTRNTISYLQIQKKAGIKAFQIFDSWAGVLPAEEFQKFCVPYLNRIFHAVDLPSIYFSRNTAGLLPALDDIDADMLSVDQSVILGSRDLLRMTKKGMQGNLFHGLLYSDKKVIKKAVVNCLKGGIKHKKYIFNLSHGVFPDTSVDALKYIVDIIHTFRWKK